MKRILREKQIEFNDPQKFDPDSRDAYWEKDESGPEENDVVVDDYFIWERGKSNSNIKDTGENKGGFSFYYARHTYDDDYFYTIPIRKNKKQVISNRFHGVGELPNNERLLVIDVNEVLDNGKQYIRIISARFANEREQEMYEHNKDIKIKAKNRRRENNQDWRIRFQEIVSQKE